MRAVPSAAPDGTASGTLRQNRALAIVLIAGLALRLSGIFWGLPLLDPWEGRYHPDEPKIITGAAEFPGHILSNRDFRYPTLTHYSLGLISTPLSALEVNPELRFNFIGLLGRLISVGMGVGAVALTYLLARRMLGAREALLASFALSFSLYHAQSSSWATTDVPGSFYLVVFLLLACWAVEREGSSIAYALAGSAFGLLLGTRYTGIVAIIPFGAIYLAERWDSDPETNIAMFIGRTIRDTRLIVFALSATLWFILSTPGLLLHPAAILESIRFESLRLGQSYMPRTELAVWIGVVRKLMISMGAPFAAFSLLGMIIFLSRRIAIRISLVLMVFVVIGYFGNALLSRYFILIMPVLAIFAAAGMWRIYTAASGRVRPLVILLLVAAGLYSVAYSIGGATSRFGDTRTAAAHYLRGELSSGSTVGIGYSSEEYGWRTHPFRYPRIDSDRFEEVDFLDRPEFIVLSSYDFEPILDTLQSGMLDPDFNLPGDLHREWYRSSPPSPRIFRLYLELLEADEGEYCLVESFKRDVYAPVEFPPPEIRIYAKRMLQAGSWCD